MSFPKWALFLAQVKLIVFVDGVTVKLLSRKILKFENLGSPYSLLTYIWLVLQELFSRIFSLFYYVIQWRKPTVSGVIHNRWMDLFRGGGCVLPPGPSTTCLGLWPWDVNCPSSLTLATFWETYKLSPSLPRPVRSLTRAEWQAHQKGTEFMCHTPLALQEEQTSWGLTLLPGAGDLIHNSQFSSPLL